MNLNLLLELNTMFSKPFGYAPLWAAWLATHRYHAQRKFTLHGRRLFVQAIPSMITIGITKLVLLMCAAFELLDRLATKAAWKRFGRTNYASFLCRKIGMLTRSRTVCANATRRSHEFSATTLTRSLSALCDLFGNLSTPYLLTRFRANARFAPSLIAHKRLMAYITGSCA